MHSLIFSGRRVSRLWRPGPSEQLIRNREVSLHTRDECLHLSGRQTTNLPRGECTQPKSYLSGHAEALSRLQAKSTVHHRDLSADCDPRARTGAATSPRTDDSSGIRCGAMPTSESRSTVCRAQEPDRTAACAAAKTEVRSRAVLSRCHSPKPQTTGSVPESEISTIGYCSDLK